MKFAQLIEYNVRNSFLVKSCRNCGEETSTKHFSKKCKLEKSLEVLYSLFLLYAKLRAIEIFETKLQITCFCLL